MSIYHKMKIEDKYITLIKSGIKKREYRLNDDFRSSIKIKEYLRLVSDSTYPKYIDVEVLGKKEYKSWDDALKENWKSDFHGLNLTYEEVLDECKKYYSDKQVDKYGIVVFDIEPKKIKFKNKKVLLDTNIIIYRESNRIVSFSVTEMYKWFDKINMVKQVHPRTKEELTNHQDEKIREPMISKLAAYQELVPKEINDYIFEKTMSSFSNNSNDKIDNEFLYQVYYGISDFLITNDKKILRKAEKLYLKEQVFSVDDFLKYIELEHPTLIDYEVLSVRLKKFGEIDVNNSFFNSLIEDYIGFEKWFIRKNSEDAYVFEQDGIIKGFLYLKIEDENENYSQITPELPPARRLKVGTFKTDLGETRKGFRVGERFLKIIFDNAKQNNVDEIYVTMFENKRDEVKFLIEFMKRWGFVYHGTNDNGEIVLVKKMKVYDESKDPKFNFPNIKNSPKYYFLPIYSDFHTSLFPDSILKNEDVNLYRDNVAHRYSLKKTYISAVRNIQATPGDIIVIYRMGERNPKTYSSVVTGLAVLQEHLEPNDINDFVEKCKNRTVFNKDELRREYEKNRRKVINLLYLESFDNKIILKKLREWGIIDYGSGPRQFMEIEESKFIEICKEGRKL